MLKRAKARVIKENKCFHVYHEDIRKRKGKGLLPFILHFSHPFTLKSFI
jgi:hypothetical protein